MTQPTAKPTVKPSSRKGSSTSAISENGAAVTHINKELSHKVQQDALNSDATLPDKASLLALFMVPVSETMTTEKTSTSPTDSSSTPLSANPINPSTSDPSIATQRVALYRAQHERTRLLYMATSSTRPTYLVQTLKSQFEEYQQYLLAEQLDKRGLLDTESLERLWQQLHVVDDIIADIVRHMPAQQPAGWQLTTQDGRNPLRFATIGKLKYPKPIRDQASLNSYVLGHFGVNSFTYDRGYYIGHVVGYLFSCYFCAHLAISYGVNALGAQVVDGYDYATLETPHMVRLLQGLDGYCKKRIYQLAVICARLSVYASDKRIEKMLIAEVNDFDKKLQQQHLDMLLLQGMMPDSSDSTPLF